MKPAKTKTILILQSAIVVNNVKYIWSMHSCRNCSADSGRGVAKEVTPCKHLLPSAAHAVLPLMRATEVAEYHADAINS